MDEWSLNERSPLTLTHSSAASGWYPVHLCPFYKQTAGDLKNPVPASECFSSATGLKSFKDFGFIHLVTGTIIECFQIAGIFYSSRDSIKIMSKILQSSSKQVLSTFPQITSGPRFFLLWVCLNNFATVSTSMVIWT